MRNDARIRMTRRLLKEGLFRCLEKTPASRITVSELCKESGVNRATFYNHYETLLMLLREITFEYAREIVRNNMENNVFISEKARNESKEEMYLEAVVTASAALSLIHIWISDEINKTPREVLDILKRCFDKKLFS